MPTATASEPTSQELATLIHLATLTHLEGQVRAAKTLQELQFVAVNETRRLVPYEQAVLFSAVDSGTTSYRAVTASSVASPSNETKHTGNTGRGSGAENA